MVRFQAKLAAAEREAREAKQASLANKAATAGQKFTLRSSPPGMAMAVPESGWEGASHALHRSNIQILERSHPNTFKLLDSFRCADT